MSVGDTIALAGIVVAAVVAIGIAVWQRKRAIAPKISISVRKRGAFSDGSYLDPGDNFRAQRPPAFEPPRFLLFVAVKNEREAPVKIKRLGVRVHDRFDDFAGDDLGPNHRFPHLPRTLDGFDTIEFYVDPGEVKRILEGLFAGDDSTFTIEAIDAIDRRYPSPPMPSAERLFGTDRFSARYHVPNPPVITVGEEEDFPDGVPLDGSDRGKQPSPPA